MHLIYAGGEFKEESCEKNAIVPNSKTQLTII